jgi:hypothetical protein
MYSRWKWSKSKSKPMVNAELLKTFRLPEAEDKSDLAIFDPERLDVAGAVAEAPCPSSAKHRFPLQAPLRNFFIYLRGHFRVGASIRILAPGVGGQILPSWQPSSSSGCGAGVEIACFILMHESEGIMTTYVMEGKHRRANITRAGCSAGRNVKHRPGRRGRRVDGDAA